MNASNRILEIIEKSGLTASEFAEKIDVQPSAISHLTSGRNKPSLEFLIKIKNAFPNIDTDWLFLGIRNQEENEVKDTPILVESNEGISRQLNTEQKETTHPKTNKNLIRVLLFFDDGSFEHYDLK
ncbi:MAG TPA: helix-turn-helix transcriptional regulator [Moheibacter sp.]|nr:helix-turn-helix transcriptional regulator [Moheibacter sp.]